MHIRKLKAKDVRRADLKEIKASLLFPFPQSCEMRDCEDDPNAFIGAENVSTVIRAIPIADICSAALSPICPTIIVPKKL
jgi:hypothetical protein